MTRVGVDVLDRRELARLLDRPWFLQYSYASEEMAHTRGMGHERRLEFLAGRFAAKEAILKALGLGMLQGIAPREICVDRAENGSPVVRFQGRAAHLEHQRISVSIAHKQNVVIAVALSLLRQTVSDATGSRRAEGEEDSVMPESGDEPTTAFLRVRIGQEDAHYGGELVAGARILQLFGDLVTEITIRTDGDEGLLSEYSAVRFTAPVRPGDYIEASARLVRKTRLRRVIEMQAHKVISGQSGTCSSAARTLDEPLLVCSATATTVIPVRANAEPRKS